MSPDRTNHTAGPLSHVPPLRRAPWVTVAAFGLGLVWVIATVHFLGQGRWLVGLTVAASAPVAYLAWRLPKEKYVLFAAIAAALSTAATLAFGFGLDLFLHARYSDLGGYNIWGYRGPVAGAKPAGEWRAVVLGGSTAFGYGVRVNQAIPAQLAREVARIRPSLQVNVVNLGWNGQGARSFRFTLEAYDYLHYDAAILYSGYNDLFFNNLSFREESAVFRLTGYLPILPVVPVRDWLHVRDLSLQKRDDRVAFNPNLADRYASEAADTALRISRELERQLGKLTPGAAPDPRAATGNCDDKWEYYCQSIYRAVEYAVAQNRTVFVVTEPYISDDHVAQQSQMAGMLRTRFTGDRRVRYVNLGHALSLKQTELCYDGMHLTASGNQLVAEKLAAAIQANLP